MWNPEIKPETLNSFSKGSMLEHLEIQFTEITSESLSATMPVDHRTTQPMGILHGGASAVLAESIGSTASQLILGEQGLTAVGTSINTNHLKAKSSGVVTGTARPVRIGRKVHVWQIDITDEENNLISSSVLTTMVIEQKSR